MKDLNKWFVITTISVHSSRANIVYTKFYTPLRVYHTFYLSSIVQFVGNRIHQFINCFFGKIQFFMRNKIFNQNISLDCKEELHYQLYSIFRARSTVMLIWLLFTLSSFYFFERKNCLWYIITTIKRNLSTP